MNKVICKEFLGVFFLPFFCLLCGLANAERHLQTIVNDSVSLEDKEVKLMLASSKKGATYLVQHGSALLDSLTGTGKECQFIFPVSLLENGKNELQITEKAPGHLRMSKIIVTVVQKIQESGETQLEQMEDKPFESALIYPNPTNSSFSILPSEHVEKLEIYSSTNEIRKIITEKIGEKISIADLPNGIYTIRIFIGTDIKESKLIKQ